MRTSRRPLVLVVDEDRDTRELYRLVFDLAGYRVTEARSIREAVTLSRAEAPAVTLCDWTFSDGDGRALAREIADQASGTALFAVTGVTMSESAVADARRRGFQRVLVKPVPPDALVRTVGELVNQKPAVGR